MLRAPSGGDAGDPDAPEPPPAATGAGILQAQAAKLIPRDAMVAGAMAGPERFFTLVGRDAIVAKLGPLYEEAVDEMKREIGQDLLSLEGMRAFGIDPSAPAGAFLWSVQDQSLGFFFGLSDRDKFTGKVKALALQERERLAEFTEGDAKILCPANDTEVCLVIRETYAYVAGSDRGDEEGLRVAKNLAKMTDATSLAANKSFSQVMANVPGGADAGMWVDVSGLVALAMADMRGVRGGERKILEDVLGPMKGFGMGLDFGAADAQANGFLAMEDGALVGTMVKNHTRVPPLVHALGEEPMMMAAYAVDLPAIVRFVETIAKQEGEDLSKMRQEMKGATGLDFDEDVLAALSGEFGFAVNVKLDELYASVMEPPRVDGMGTSEVVMLRALDGAATLGFTSAEAGKGLIDKVMAIPPVKAFVTRDEAKQRWTIPTPVGKSFYVALSEPQGGSPALVVATTEDLLTRVRKGVPAPAFSGKPVNRGYANFLAQADVAGLYAGRQTMLGAMAWFGLSMTVDAPRPPTAEGASPELKKKLAELDAVRAEQTKMREEQQKAMLGVLRDVFEPWGATAISAKKVPGGMQVRAGQFLEAKSWSALALAMTDAGLKGFEMGRSTDERQSELWEKESKLADEVRALGGNPYGWDMPTVAKEATAVEKQGSPPPMDPQPKEATVEKKAPPSDGADPTP